MPTLQVQPRPTPAERAEEPVEVEVDEALTVLAETIKDGIAKVAHATPNGLDVELRHILTFT